MPKPIAELVEMAGRVEPLDPFCTCLGCREKRGLRDNFAHAAREWFLAQLCEKHDQVRTGSRICSACLAESLQEQPIPVEDDDA